MLRRHLSVLLSAGALLVGLSQPASARDQEPSRPAVNEDERATFLRWLHTDVLWVPAESGNSTYGLIGVHLVVARVKRIDIYGPPGVMLLRQKTSTGWMYRPGFTWGMSIRLVDLKVPGVNRPLTAFINVSRCWTNGGEENAMDMVGFSFTWRR